MGGTPMPSGMFVSAARLIGMSDAMRVCLLSKSGVYRIAWFGMMKRQEHSIELVQVGKCERQERKHEQEHKRERVHKREQVHKRE